MLASKQLARIFLQASAAATRHEPASNKVHLHVPRTIRNGGMEKFGCLERELRLWTKSRFLNGTSAASTSPQPLSKLDGTCTIVGEVMHSWNDTKLRFGKTEWLAVLAQMKKHKTLMPTGFGKPTSGGMLSLPDFE